MGRLQRFSRCPANGGYRAQKRRPLDHNPLDLIEADLVAAAVIELRRSRRGMVRHRGGLFERAAILEIGGDPGRPEAMVAELGSDAGCRGAPADHRIGIRLRQHGVRQLVGAASDRAEQRPLGIVANTRARRMGRDEEEGVELREMLDDPDLDFGDFIAAAIVAAVSRGARGHFPAVFSLSESRVVDA